MLPQTRLRWKAFFEWLGNLPIEKIEPRSKAFYGRHYMEAHKKLKLHKTCFNQSSNEEITAMMLEFRISFVKQAKMLFMLSIPIVYVDQMNGIKNSAKIIEFDKENRITKYESNNGRVKFEGAHDHKTKRNDFVYIDDDEEENLEVIPEKKRRGEPKPRAALLPKKKKAQQGDSDDDVVSNANDSDEDIDGGSRNEEAPELDNLDNFDNDSSEVSEAMEESDDEVALAANQHAQPESDEEPEDDSIEMEVEKDDDSDAEEMNIDTTSTESMLSFIMKDDVRNDASRSQVGSSNEPSTSDAGLATSRERVGVSQINEKLTEDPTDLTLARSKCIRSTEAVQNRRNLPRISQDIQETVSSVGSFFSSESIVPVTSNPESGLASSVKRHSVSRLDEKLAEDPVAPTYTGQVDSSKSVEPSSSSDSVVPVPSTLVSGSTSSFKRPPVPPINVKPAENPVTPTSDSQVGSPDEPSTSSCSSAAVAVSQVLAEVPIAPTPAKRRCLRSIQSFQDGSNLPSASQIVASSPRVVSIPNDTPSTLGAGPIPPVPLRPRRNQSDEPSSSSAPDVSVPSTSAAVLSVSPRRSKRTVTVPKKSENKENVPSTSDSEPGPSTSTPTVQQQSQKAKKDNVPPQVQPAAKPIAIGAAIMGADEGPKRFYFPRSQLLPTGLGRSPFNGELPKDIRRKCEYRKIMRKFKVQKHQNFPKSTLEGQMIESVLGKEAERPEKATFPDDPSSNDPKGAAVIEKFLGDEPAQDYKDADDQEEVLWSAEKLEEHMEGDEQKMEAFYKDIEEKYLFAVWRQFESRIPLEYALQNLQKKNYDIAAALGSIDEYLKRLPQKMKTPSAAQVEYLATEFEDSKEHVDLSWCQDNVMRNMHMAEIHNYYYKFRRFFEFREVEEDKDPIPGLMLRVGCNCHQKKCRSLVYEPRFGCANCTNHLRRHRLPADKLCLLCITKLESTGTAQSAEDVVLDADDLEKIRKWDEETPRMSRIGFEKWIQDQKNERYKKLWLTQEEVLMLDFEKLTIDNLAEEVTAQLQPYVLPHFSHCRCWQGLPVANPPPEIPDL